MTREGSRLSSSRLMAASPLFTCPAGELYRFTARHSLLLFVLAFVLHVPLIIEDLFSHKYTVHKNGVIVITGA